jgi:hypothetical protein
VNHVRQPLSMCIIAHLEILVKYYFSGVSHNDSKVIIVRHVPGCSASLALRANGPPMMLGRYVRFAHTPSSQRTPPPVRKFYLLYYINAPLSRTILRGGLIGTPLTTAREAGGGKGVPYNSGVIAL